MHVNPVSWRGLALHKLAGRGDFYAMVGPNKQRIQVALTRPSDWERLNYIEGIQSAKVARLVADSSHAYIGDVSRPAHRPKIEANPYAVGFYLHHGPDNVTQVAAKERLDLSRKAHEVNRNFTNKVVRALRALRKVT